MQAVVSCWGDVVAGTQGVRAEHARIDAMWLHPTAPGWLRQRVAGRYPSARIYADPDAMLAEHPLTALACYEPPRPRRRCRGAAAVGLRGRCSPSARCRTALLRRTPPSGTAGSRRPAVAAVRRVAR